VEIRIGLPRFSGGGQEFNVSYPISGLDSPTLYFTVSGADRDFISDDLNAPLLALLPVAMAGGHDLVCDGPVSPEFLFHVRTAVLPLFLRSTPGTRHVTIRAEQTQPATLRGSPAVLAGLSNGIDSLCLYLQHSDPAAPERLRLTHFVFNDFGSHSDTTDLRRQARFQARGKAVAASADQIGLPLVSIASNLGRILPYSTEQTHTLRNASVALLLGGRAQTFLYASAVRFDDFSLDAGDTAFIDPILLPAIRTESLSSVSSGGQLSRVQKTAIVAEAEIARDHLNVCVTSFPNCSQCWKCARTIFTLELLGKDRLFERVFDLDKFQQVRTRYIAHVLLTSSRSPFARDILELMRQRGFRAPFASRLRTAFALPVAQVRPAYRRLIGFPAGH
jgi:hypothetical protein